MVKSKQEPVAVDDKFLLGIDLGGTNIKAALFNRQGKLLLKTELPTGTPEPAQVVERLVEVANQLLCQADLRFEHIWGVGVGSPGNIDSKSGTVLYSPNLFWQNVPLKAMLERRLGVEVFLDNDANAAALGEHWQGAGQGFAHMLMVVIGTGVGGGLILNDQLYRGATGSAGEIGHTILFAEGPRCNCGIQGHLEALCSAPWLVRQAETALAEGQASKLSSYDHLEAKDIFAEATAGDRLAEQIVNKAVQYLAMGLANLVNLLNPELIVLGGGVAQAGEMLLAPLRQQVNQLALGVPAGTVQIVAAKLGNLAGCYGAAAMILHEK